MSTRRDGWFPVIPGRDAGGPRDFLAGRPIHCGSALELRTGAWATDKDGQDEIRWQETGIVVRYEVADVWRFVRKPVACNHCKSGKCGCKGEPTCCYCLGTGDMSGSIVTRDAEGSWQWVSVAMLHHQVGNWEFKKELGADMLFRWPRSAR